MGGGAVAPPFLGSQGKGDTDKKGKLKATIFFETYIIRKLKLGKTQNANKTKHDIISKPSFFSVC